MPDTILLLNYLPRNTFIDWVSQETSTEVTKSKYKLLYKHHKDMGVYVFFVLTTNKSACVKDRTFSIYLRDWEHREGTHLDANCSYIDVQKCITMNDAEVVEKASNPRIGFSYVGKLLQLKFQELSTLIKDYMLSSTQKTDFGVRDMLKGILLDDNADKFVKKMGI